MVDTSNKKSRVSPVAASRDDETTNQGGEGTSQAETSTAETSLLNGVEGGVEGDEGDQAAMEAQAELEREAKRKRFSARGKVAAIASAAVRAQRRAEQDALAASTSKVATSPVTTGIRANSRGKNSQSGTTPNTTINPPSSDASLHIQSPRPAVASTLVPPELASELAAQAGRLYDLPAQGSTTS